MWQMRVKRQYLHVPTLHTTMAILLVAQIISSIVQFIVIGIYMFVGSATADGSDGTSDEQFPQTMFLPFHATRAALVVLTAITLLDAAFAGYTLWHLFECRRAGLYAYPLFKLVSLALYIVIFVLYTSWTGSEVAIWVLHIVLCTAQVALCAWLCRALDIGGEDAVDVGFDRDKVQQREALLRAKNDKKGEEVETAHA